MKKVGMMMLSLVFLFCLTGCLPIMLLSPIGEEKDNQATFTTTQVTEPITVPMTTTTTVTTSKPTTTTKTAALGTRNNPYVITAQKLAAEINANKTAAGEKYNNKWVKITGEITDFSDGGIIYGYYLYGKKGASGLRIVCWCDSQYKGGMVGGTYTFVGQMREVTTFNATEIGDCKVVK